MRSKSDRAGRVAPLGAVAGASIAKTRFFLGCPLYFKNSLSMDRLAAGLEEKPTATLRLVDPILDQAGSRDIAEFVDHFMQFSQTRD
jgi:hypothetical protein